MPHRDPERTARRRDVLDDARRSVERALLLRPHADALADAAESLLAQECLSDASSQALRGALDRYRAASQL